MSKPILKRFFDLFKTQYRLVEVNTFYKYETQQRFWYSFGKWFTIKKSRTDFLNVAKERFRTIVYGPIIIQNATKGEDEVY